MKTWQARQDARLYKRTATGDWAEVLLGGISVTGIVLALMMI